MPAAAYRYKPLRNPDHIRLVCLHPHSSSDASIMDSPPSIDIKTITIGEFPYTALSYVWGKGDQDQPLLVTDNGSTGTINITETLQAALQHLAKAGLKHVWIDQLSINQKDLGERSKHVGRMSSIYNHASKVVIWLGKEADDSTPAMQFIRDISVLNLDRQARDPEKRKLWSALAKLIAREWFTRRWIIQEVAFAQKAELWCGDATPVPWPQFAEAVTLFESKLDIVRVQRKAEKLDKATQTLANVAEL